MKVNSVFNTTTLQSHIFKETLGSTMTIPPPSELINTCISLLLVPF